MENKPTQSSINVPCAETGRWLVGLVDKLVDGELELESQSKKAKQLFCICQLYISNSKIDIGTTRKCYKHNAPQKS